MNEALKEVRGKMNAVLTDSLFECNDEETWGGVRKELTQHLNTMIDEGKIYDFSVRCDQVNNTSETIDERELHLDAAVKVDKDSEFVLITGTIKPE